MKDFRGTVCTYHYNKKPGDKINCQMLMDGKICEVVGLIDAVTCGRYGLEYPTWDIRFEDNCELLATENNLTYEGKNAKTPKESIVGSICVYNPNPRNAKQFGHVGEMCLVIGRENDDEINDWGIGEMFSIMFADGKEHAGIKKELTKLTVIE